MGLNRFNLVVICAGALGSSLLLHISKDVFGSVKIVDGDIVTKKNLSNQKLYDITDVLGPKRKADAAVEHLETLNNTTKFLSRPFYIGERNILKVIRGTNLVIDLTDNIETRLIINDACAAQKIPLLVTSLRGSEGFFYLIDWNGACFNCIYRNASVKAMVEKGDCARISSRYAKILTKLILNEIELFFADRGKEHVFNSISLSDGTIKKVKINRDGHCEACGKHEYLHKLENGFIQMCGDGIKFSLQRSLDLKKLAEKLHIVDYGVKNDVIFFKRGKKSVLISDDGDFLFTGYSKASAQNFIAGLFYKKS